MPLSQPADRERIHTRSYEFGGYHRADGLWDIEGHMTDTKTYPVDNRDRGRLEPGDPVHDMWLRLTIDEDMVVHGIEAVTDAGPFTLCPAITPNFQRMVGHRIGAGWRGAIRKELGGVHGCTHLVEMLGAMGTVAYQTLYSARVRKAKDQAKANGGPRPKSPLIDSCHAFASNGPVVKREWPEHYTGTG